MDEMNPGQAMPDPEEIQKAASKYCWREMLRLGLGFAAFLLCIQVGAALCVVVAGLIRPELLFEMDTAFLIVVNMVAIYGVGLPVFWLIIRGMGKQDIANRFFVPSGLGTIVVAFSIGYGGSMLLNMGTLMMVQLIEMVTGKTLYQPLDIMMEPTFILFFYSVIAAPVMEELIFRKLILDRLRKYGDLFAILMNGLLFALFHQNFYQLFYAFFLGAVFSYVVLRYGRLWYTIAMHMVFNGVSFLSTVALEAESIFAMGLLGWLMVVLIIVGVTLFFVFRWRIFLQKSWQPISDRRKWGIWIKNPGTWVMLLVAGVFTVITALSGS